MSNTLSRAGYLACRMPGNLQFIPAREIRLAACGSKFALPRAVSVSSFRPPLQPNETHLTVGLMEPAGPLRNLVRVDRYFSRGTVSPRRSSHGGRT